MWNELEHKLDCLFEEYFEKRDYSAEVKEQLVDYALEVIRNLLYPKNRQVYYKEAPLGLVYIGNEEIKGWIADFINIYENKTDRRLFHEHLHEMVMKATIRESEWLQRQNDNVADPNCDKMWVRNSGKIRKAANFYALEYLKEKRCVSQEERENLWTENAELAWTFATMLVKHYRGNYYYAPNDRRNYPKILEFNPSIHGKQQATFRNGTKYRDGITKASFDYERIKEFLQGYEDNRANFCGRHLDQCMYYYYLDLESNTEIISSDISIKKDDVDGPSIINLIPDKTEENDPVLAINIELSIAQFVNLTKVLSDFTRIHDSVTGRTQNDKIKKWHRFLVFYTRNYVDEICEIFESSWIRKINRDIDIIFRSHYRKFEIKNKITKETHIIDYTDCSVCQTYINCLENKESETEAQSIEKIRGHKPAYVNAVALHRKRCDNELIDERIKKDYLNQYFGHSNLSDAIQEYEKMGQLLRKQGKLDYTNETRDAYLYWLNTYGATYGIYSEEELVNRYTGQNLEIKFYTRIADEKCIAYLKGEREENDRLILTQFTMKRTDIDAITRGITQAYRIAVTIFDKIYGDGHILSAYRKNEEEYCRIKRDQIINKPKKSIG